MRQVTVQSQLQAIKTHSSCVGQLRKAWCLAALGGLFSAGLGLSVAQAQEESSAAIEEVIVTGSYIKSSPKDGASPVDIITRDYIDESGAVTIADITRNITANSGSENVADSFTSGATQGTSNVNLRGLGLGSTLILVNGRRNTLAAATANDGSSFVDTSMIPAIAVQRVEVLKEGAASIYGSDAVAGVVNYILRTDFEGTEISALYKSTTSDGQKDKQISVLHGWSNDRTNVVLAAQRLDRSPLSSADRLELVQRAVSGLGNSFLLFGASTVASGPYEGTYSGLTNVPDANCVPAGGRLIPQGNPPGSGGQRCGFFYGPRFNVVHEEEHTHLYANVKHELNSGLELSAEALWANVEVLDNPQSPSYPALAYLSASRAIRPDQAGNPFGVPILWLGRPLGSSYPSPKAPRDNKQYRIAFALDGEVGAYHFNTALTRSTYDAFLSQPDTSTSRFEDAIAGRGGPGGNLSWDLFNPTNNSQELIDYVSVQQDSDVDTNLTVFDFVIDRAEQGRVGFATGLQIRHEELEISRNDISRVEFDADGNLTKPADLIFLGGGVNVDESRLAWGAFAEFQWDATDALEVRLAGRYEDLESGSTLDPKLSARFQPVDSLVLRASISSSYREPSLYQLHASSVGLQGIQDFNADGSKKGTPVFIRIAQDANDKLDAEQANNLNIGVIWKPLDGLHISLDYWAVDYTDVITIENAQGKVDADLLQPDVKRTVDGILTGVTTNYFNAAEVKTDGLDLAISYLFPEGKLGAFSLTFDAVRMLSYKIPLNGVTTDVVGLFNHNTFARSLPETKMNAALRWERGNHKASLAARYISSYKTTRTSPPAGFSQNIDSFLTWDIQYNYDLKLAAVNTRITVGVLNATDEEPPLVWDSVNYSYDSRQHDARGRMAYVSLKFGF